MSKEWWFESGGARVGPVSQGEIEDQIGSGNIGAETLVWTEGQGTWQPLTETELSSALKLPPELPPALPPKSAVPTPPASAPPPSPAKDDPVKQKDQADTTAGLLFWLVVLVVLILYFGAEFLFSTVGVNGIKAVFAILGLAITYSGIKSIVAYIKLSKFISALGAAGFMGLGLYLCLNSLYTMTRLFG